MDEKQHDLEQQITDLLESDESDREEVNAEALRKLAPRYEIRIQAEFDPIAEETKRYRELAEEVDERYKKYDS